MILKNKTGFMIVLILLFFMFAVNFNTQAGVMGNTGFAALGNNPAAVNLENNKFHLSFASDMEIFNNLLLNGYIDDELTESLLAGVSDSGWVIGSKAYFGGSLGIGPVTGFAGGGQEALVKINPDVAELLLKGNQVERKYSLEGTEGMLALYGQGGVNLSLAVPGDYLERIEQDSLQIKNLQVGISLRQLAGVISEFNADGAIELTYDQEGNPQLEGEDAYIELWYNDHTAQQLSLATGTVFDLGLYAELDDQLSVAFSLLNIGSMQVTGVLYSKYEFKFDNDEEELEEVEEVLLPDKTLKWNVPTELRMAAFYDMDWFDVSGEFARISYQQGVNDHRLTAGVATDYVSWLPVKMAATYSSLRNSVVISAGAGIHPGPVRLNVNASDLSGMFNRAKSTSMELSLGLEF